MGQPTATPQRPFDLIVVAASAGGVQALLTLFSGLPRDFPVPIAVVLHRSARAPNMLVEVLGRRTALSVKLASAGEAPCPGAIHVAPPPTVT